MVYGITVSKGGKRVIINSSLNKVAKYKTKSSAKKEIDEYLTAGKNKGKFLTKSLNPRIVKL